MRKHECANLRSKQIAKFPGWRHLALDSSLLLRNGIDGTQAEANTIFRMLEQDLRTLVPEIRGLPAVGDVHVGEDSCRIVNVKSGLELEVNGTTPAIAIDGRTFPFQRTIGSLL
jgi:hypothetical protein